MSDDCFFFCSGIRVDPWPIPQAAALIAETINGIQFLLIGLPDGSFGVRVVRDGVNEDYETDMLATNGDFKVVVSVNYSPLRPCVRVNGLEIEVAPIYSREKNLVSLHAPLATVPRDPPFLSYEVPEQASDAEALFVRTVAELAGASVSNDWYLLLKSSSHLRLLLLDGLLHKANERHKIKLQFCVAAPGELSPIEIDKRWWSVSPKDLPEDQVMYVNLDQFMKFRAYNSAGETVTLKDVIRAAANADGGVHFDSPRNSQDKLVLALDEESMRFGQVASRHILRQICGVVVAGTAPLVKRIQEKAASRVESSRSDFLPQ